MCIRVCTSYCVCLYVCNQGSVQGWVNGLTHSLLSRVASLAWPGSGRSRSGWSSSPCALQRLVELERWSHTLSLPQSHTPLTLCLLNMCHTWRRDVWTINHMLDGSTYSTHTFLTFCSSLPRLTLWFSCCFFLSRSNKPPTHSVRPRASSSPLS